MLLALDVGNTNVTLGIVTGGVVASSRRGRTDPNATPDEAEVLLRDLLALDGVTLDDVTAIAVASVVPTLTGSLETVAGRHGIPILVASSGTVPIAIRVDRPHEVGADRLVNGLAAARLYGTPAIVVDVGTATTLDCVAADGGFVGGAIAPGLELGLAALASGTAKLPHVELETPERAIGRDTASAIRSGAVLGHQVLVAGLVAHARAELEETQPADATDRGDAVAARHVHVVLTGGLAAAPWARDIEGIDAIDPGLTLKGLAILHAEVAGGEPLRHERGPGARRAFESPAGPLAASEPGR